jgi:RNA polymerase sigma factor (sigma-70 family)
MVGTKGSGNIINKTVSNIHSVDDVSLFKEVWEIRVQKLSYFCDKKQEMIDYFNLHKSSFQNMKKTREYDENDVEIILDTLVMEEINKNIKLKRKFDRVFRYHSRLVGNMVKKSKSVYYDIEFDELFQQGLLGLRIAILRFNWYLGYQFSTYAHLWVKQSISRYINLNKDFIYLPLKKSETLNRLSRELSKGFTKKEVMKKMKMSEETFREYEQFNRLRNVFSLDKPLESDKDDTGSTLMDMVDTGDKYTALDEISSYMIDKDEFYRIMKNILPDNRSYDILKLRLSGVSLADIGKIYGISRERVRQIEMNIHRCIKKHKKTIYEKLELS